MPNIEIKAKCNNFELARETANRLKTAYVGELHQIDTYFTTKKGRLKLREINGQQAQLIPYLKEYTTGPMKSSYSVLPVEDVENVKNIFNEILGVVTVVDNKREVFLIDNVRVHFDEVRDLGTFIEFEAVYEEKSAKDKDREVEKVSQLMDTFKIKKEDLLDKSYIDYLLNKDKVFDNLRLIYSFESDSLIILEIEKKNIDKLSPPDKRFFWLKYDKESKKLERLDFVSMKSERELENRVFAQGEFKFNPFQGTFLDSRGEHKLYLQKILSDEFKGVILSYFAN